MWAFLVDLAKAALQQSLDLVGGTTWAVVFWLLGSAIALILVFVFRGREAFNEHLKANVLIVIAVSILSWLTVFTAEFAWVPREISAQAAHVQVPALRTSPLGPTAEELFSEQVMAMLYDRTEDHQTKDDPFILAAGPVMASSQRIHPLALRMVRSGNIVTVYPINILLHLGVINNQPRTTMIDRYQVDVKWPGHPSWILLVHVPTIAGQIIISPLGDGPLIGHSIDGNRFLDREIMEKTLAANSAAMGWIAVKYPESLHELKGPFDIRITVFDVAGRRGTTFFRSKNADADSAQTVGLQVDGKVDLSFTKTKPLSQ